MRPRTNHVRARKPEDEQRIEDALKAIQKHLAIQDLAQAETILRIFLRNNEIADLAHPEDAAVTPLSETRRQIKALDNLSDKLDVLLEQIRSNDNINGELISQGVDLDSYQQQALTARNAARSIEEALPSSSGWPNVLHATRELIRDLAAYYEMTTGLSARQGISYSRKEAAYRGPFYELISDVAYNLDLSDRGTEGLGKLIIRSLK